MLSLCINTVHSLLAFSHSEEIYYLEDSNKLHCRNMLSGLSMVIGECRKPANVLESVSVKKDSSGFVSGSVMEGMSSCTESLGSESSDQLEEEEEKEEDKESRSQSISRSRSRLLRFRRTIESDRRTEDGKKMIFPPPISSLSQNGHPSSYLKSVRKNGRLEITEVKIHRPEILRASRQNGRLTLHLIQTESQPDPEPESVPELEEKLIKESDESVEKSVQRLPRRCYDHRPQLPIWSNNHCVMTG